MRGNCSSFTFWAFSGLARSIDFPRSFEWFSQQFRLVFPAVSSGLLANSGEIGASSCFLLIAFAPLCPLTRASVCRYLAT